MSNWSLGSVRIYVQDLREDEDQIVARLNPLAGGTTLHFFGYDDKITKLSGIVVGRTHQASLEAFNTDATVRELMTPWGSWGNFYCKHTSFQLLPTTCQTIDLTENTDAPVWKVDIELYE